MFRGFIAVVLVLPQVLGVVQLAGAAPSGPLSQVIEGAKKEGTVLAKLAPGLNEGSISRLQKEIRNKYGVDLKIQFAASIGKTKDVSQLIMEQRVGTPPSYDLFEMMGSHMAASNKAGVMDQVEWEPLLIKGTNPAVVLDDQWQRGGIIYYTGHQGLMYNPEKINAEEAPKSLSELANPKWKGRGGLPTIQSGFLRMSFILGKEKVLSALRATLRNGVIQGEYTTLFNRYLLGEIYWSVTSSSFLKSAQDKGMPAAWQALDYEDVQEFSLVVVKGARHPNAAKLVAIYLASPEGVKFTYEEAKAGNIYYPGNYEHDIRLESQKRGIPEVIGDRKPGLLEFYGSKEGKALQNQIRLIFQSKGER